jgi:hypothetical protein
MLLGFCDRCERREGKSDVCSGPDMYTLASTMCRGNWHVMAATKGSQMISPQVYWLNASSVVSAKEVPQCWCCAVLQWRTHSAFGVLLWCRSSLTGSTTCPRYEVCHAVENSCPAAWLLASWQSPLVYAYPLYDKGCWHSTLHVTIHMPGTQCAVRRACVTSECQLHHVTPL